MRTRTFYKKKRQFPSAFLGCTQTTSATTDILDTKRNYPSFCHTALKWGFKVTSADVRQAFCLAGVVEGIPSTGRPNLLPSQWLQGWFDKAANHCLDTVPAACSAAVAFQTLATWRPCQEGWNLFSPWRALSTVSNLHTAQCRPRKLNPQRMLLKEQSPFPVTFGTRSPGMTSEGFLQEAAGVTHREESVDYISLNGA